MYRYIDIEIYMRKIANLKLKQSIFSVWQVRRWLHHSESQSSLLLRPDTNTQTYKHTHRHPHTRPDSVFAISPSILLFSQLSCLHQVCVSVPGANHCHWQPNFFFLSFHCSIHLPLTDLSAAACHSLIYLFVHLWPVCSNLKIEFSLFVVKVPYSKFSEHTIKSPEYNNKMISVWQHSSKKDTVTQLARMAPPWL